MMHDESLNEFLLACIKWIICRLKDNGMSEVLV